MNENPTSESASKPNTELPGTPTISTKEELQEAMTVFSSRKTVDIENILRLARGVPLLREVRYDSMARIPGSSIRISRSILARFSVDAMGALRCYEQLDAQGFQHLSVPRLRKKFGASAKTIGRSIRTLRRAGIIDTKQDGPYGLMIRLNPWVLADWADKLAERKRNLPRRKWQCNE